MVMITQLGPTPGSPQQELWSQPLQLGTQVQSGNLTLILNDTT